jgi:hypothetical protein
MFRKIGDSVDFGPFDRGHDSLQYLRRSAERVWQGQNWPRRTRMRLESGRNRARQQPITRCG